MSETTVYYRAAGRSLQAVLEWAESVKTVRRDRKAFLERMGTATYLGSDDEIRALVYDDPAKVPGGLKPWKAKGPTYFVPDGRTKAGKALEREMRGLAIPGYFGVGGYMEGRTHYSPGVGKLLGEWIISHHEKAEPPPDAVPMKRSEYWAMKEQAEAAACAGYDPATGLVVEDAT